MSAAISSIEWVARLEIPNQMPNFAAALAEIFQRRIDARKRLAAIVQNAPNIANHRIIMFGNIAKTIQHLRQVRGI